MKGVILDADSLGKGDVALDPITQTLNSWEVFPATSPDQVPVRIRDADVVLSNKVHLDATVFHGASELKFVSVMATGTNNIDLDAARSHNISVSNALAYATPSVVQHTFSLMLALSNNLLAYNTDVRNGRWQQSQVFCLLDHPITELSGKNLGIVGYGELGSHVATVARAFGMKVLIAARPEAPPAEGRTAFNEVLKTADYLSLHCPLTAENEGLINRETLKRMKPSAFVINTARGGLVNTPDLLDALNRGIIAGAGVDVLATEPPRPDEALTRADLGNLLVTPHNAWGARESRARLVLQMRENIDAFMAGTPIRLVN